ncbi:prepilin peptidase [Brachybacterium sp. sponge]|uniref:prepilin peptidase n=1 Tax=Brachybacterium sp. sponge TaxID=1775432 RepID=UPI0007A50025|nr:prepilin peptidase [Brachybacterium sp. sponge]
MYFVTPALWPALVAFVALAGPLLITDARSFRLPLPLNLGLLAAAIVLLPIASIWLGVSHLVMAMITASILTLLLLVVFVIARGGLGFGDVILIAGLGLYGGYVSPLLFLIGLWLGTLGTLIWALVRRRRGNPGHTPFGPGLILGTAAVMLIPLPTAA